MLKNTGAQSAASRGYGSALDMTGTVSSGITATESFMERDMVKDKKNFEAALAILQSAVDDDEARPYVFGDEKGRRELAKGQFFRSRLMSFNKDTKQAVFEIDGGKNAKGKAMKTARAFYMVNVNIEAGSSPWGGKNAMLMNMEMEYALGNINVKGHSTFMEKFSLGADNASMGTVGVFNFLPDDNTREGSVFFNERAKLEKQVNFEVPTFFNEDALINNGVTFKDYVGFNAHISTGTNQTPINVKQDVWVREGFKTLDYSGGYTSTNLKTSFKGTGSTQSNLYYTDHLPYPGNTSMCGGQNEGKDYIDWQCAEVKLSSFTNVNTGTDNQSAFASMTTASILSNIGMTNEAAAAAQKPSDPGAAAANSRVADEPDLNPANLPKGKTFLTLADLEPGNVGKDGGLSNVTLKQVNDWYKTFPQSQYPQYYSDGHLLVKVTGNINFAAAAADADDADEALFNNKIAFNIDNGGSISGKWFNSSIADGSNASTLIYVGETGRLNEFGTTGDFRGLIYVDEKNNNPTQQNTFRWGANSHIDGAVILKGKGRVNWNGGTVTITKNDAVLAGYSGFITRDPNDPPTTATVTVETGKTRISLTPVGYYYGLK